MRVYVTARGDAYHDSSMCPRILSAHKAAETNGYTVHPPRRMSLEEAMAWKKVTPCPTCWEHDALPEPRQPRYDLVGLDAVEVRYTVGFGAAATTAKGFLLIPRLQWEAILPEDRHERVLEMIKEQAAKELLIEYGVVK